MIGFIGSVFSPYYAWARRRGRGEPSAHCCMNVVLYGPRARWTMTERGGGALDRGTDFLSIGPSAMEWDGACLTVRIAERTTPWMQPVTGTLRIHPAALETRELHLDLHGRHRWQPLAPCARAEVELTSPGLRWSGPAYLDTNSGDAPLEQDFVRWDWSRTPVPGGTAVLYEATRRGGDVLNLAMRYSAAGGVRDVAPPPVAALPPTLWRLARQTRSEAPARVVHTLEDAPFYARSVLSTQVDGQPATAMHETLSLDRFRMPVVQAMLPFRMPRLG